MLPNLIVIGAAKAGTTSVHEYLGQHPDVYMARPRDAPTKEMAFFWRDDWLERRGWYESHFEVEAPVRGEATPAYSAYAWRPDVPRRICELVPDVRLIYLVRDPIERIMSHFAQRQADGDRVTLAQYLQSYDSPTNRLVCPSLYHTQLQRYLEYFSIDQIAVIDQHDLKNSRDETMRRLFRFVGVTDAVDSLKFGEEKNTRAEKRRPRRNMMRAWSVVRAPVSAAVPVSVMQKLEASAEPFLFGAPAKPTLDSAMRVRLQEYLAPEVQALRELTGAQFSSWSV